MDQALDICVCNPLTEKFTTYEILIQTSNPAFTLAKSRSRRRYNDFCWLKKRLRSHHPLCVCPELPVKKPSSERFEVQFLVQRMKGLEDWLHQIVGVDLYLSDTAVHLFLQTNLSCKQIDQYFDGKINEDVIRRAYRAVAIVDNSDHLFPRKQDDDEAGKSQAVPVACLNIPAGASNRNTPPEVPHGENGVPHRDIGLNENQMRADSGYAENEESDYSSSCESPFASASHSLETVGGTDRYGFPPVTEIPIETARQAERVVKNSENGEIIEHSCQCSSDCEKCIRKSCECDRGGASEDSTSNDENKNNSAGRKPVKVEMGVIFSIN